MLNEDQTAVRPLEEPMSTWAPKLAEAEGLAGVIVGLAWVAFCMTTLEVAQLYAKRNAPAMVEGTHPPQPPAAKVSTSVAAAVAGAESGERSA